MSGELTTPVYRSANLVACASALFRRAGLDRSEWDCRTRGVSGTRYSAMRSS